MEKPETNVNVEELFEKIKDYGETRIDLLKLKSINKVSTFISSILTSIFLGVLLVLIIVCVTIGLSLLIGSWLGHAYYGFFIMAAIFIIIGLVLLSSRQKIIKTPIRNKLIKDLID